MDKSKVSQASTGAADIAADAIDAELNKCGFEMTDEQYDLLVSQVEWHLKNMLTSDASADRVK